MNIPANIGHGQRQVRYVSALAIVLCTLAFAIFLVVIGAERFWRLLILFPFAAAATAFLEARTSTCVTLAMQNQCSLEKNFSVWRIVRGDSIQDNELARALRVKAYRIVAQGWGAAALVTSLFYFVP